MEHWKIAKRVAVCAVGLALMAGPLSCDCGVSSSTEIEVSVLVNSGGDGVGRVTSTDPAVDIDCLVGPGVPNPGSCSDTFVDAGAGGMFSLIAEENPGNTFVGWSGCNEVIENECVLSFDEVLDDVSFTVTASFAVNPDDECNIAFGSAPGYFLCSETPTSCSFYTLLNDIDSCATRCAAFGATCLASIRDTNDTCTPGEVGSCDDVVGDRVCECTKP